MAKLRKNAWNAKEKAIFFSFWQEFEHLPIGFDLFVESQRIGPRWRRQTVEHQLPTLLVICFWNAHKAVDLRHCGNMKRRADGVRRLLASGDIISSCQFRIVFERIVFGKVTCVWLLIQKYRQSLWFLTTLATLYILFLSIFDHPFSIILLYSTASGFFTCSNSPMKRRAVAMAPSWTLIPPAADITCQSV